MFEFVSEKKLFVISDLRNGQRDGKMQHLVRYNFELIFFIPLSHSTPFLGLFCRWHVCLSFSACN